MGESQPLVSRLRRDQRAVLHQLQQVAGEGSVTDSRRHPPRYELQASGVSSSTSDLQVQEHKVTAEMAVGAETGCPGL